MHDPMFDPSIDGDAGAKGAANRLSPEARFARDPNFRSLVTMMESMIAGCDYTPTEIREAAMLATIRHEMRTMRPMFPDRDSDRIHHGKTGG